MLKRSKESNATLRNCGHECIWQLVNHGVGIKLVEDIKKGAQELLNLSIEEKKKLWQKPGETEGFGQMFGYKEGPSDWVDLFYIFTLPSHLRKPHLFPNIPLSFRCSFSLVSFLFLLINKLITDNSGKIINF